MKEDLRNILIAWSKDIVSRYPGLKIRFEFNNDREVFLVSLYPEAIENNSGFDSAVLSFEDEMEALYGIEAPLFCDNEELFKLSASAETIVGIFEKAEKTDWTYTIEDHYDCVYSLKLVA